MHTAMSDRQSEIQRIRAVNARAAQERAELSARISELLRFLAAGAAAAALAFLVRRLLVDLGVSFSVAVPASYLACIPVGYWLNRLFVFHSEQQGPLVFAKFCISLLAGLATVSIVSMTFAAVLNGDVAHGLGICASAAVNYVLTRAIFANRE
jgi:putative flippase GtrA